MASNEVNIKQEPCIDSDCDDDDGSKEIMAVNFVAVNEIFEIKSEPLLMVDVDDEFSSDFTDETTAIENAAEVNPLLVKSPLQDHPHLASTSKPFVCAVCNRSFTLRANFVRHERMYHDPSLSFQCKQCPFRFSSEIKLAQHVMKLHKPSAKAIKLETPIEDSKSQLEVSRDDSNYCELCNRWFTIRGNYLLHIKHYHDPSLPVQCTLCAFRFASEHLLAKHHRRRHKNENKILDEKMLEFSDDVKTKITNVHHHGPKLHLCAVCNRSFRFSGSLSRHMATFHDPSLPIICEICDNRFGTDSELEKHLQRYHKAVFPAELFRCKSCDSSFRLRANFVRHNKTLHDPKLPYPCNLCACRFKAKRPLDRHLGRHLSETNIDKKFQCIYCTRMFRELPELSEHLNNANGGNKRCVRCDRDFPSRHCFVHHRNTVHLGDNRIPCTQCEQQFVKWKELRRHRSIAHSIFECIGCNLFFYNEPDMAQHECANNQSAYMQILLRHKQRDGYCPPTCDVCERQFSTFSNLAHHIRRRHSRNNSLQS